MQQRYFAISPPSISWFRYCPANSPSFLAYCRMLGTLIDPDQFMQLKHCVQSSSSMIPSSSVESEQTTRQQVGFTVPLLQCWAMRQNSKPFPTASLLTSIPEAGLTTSLPLSMKNFWLLFLSTMVQTSRMGSQDLETLLSISLMSVTSACTARERSNLVLPFLRMMTSVGECWHCTMYSLRHSKMICFMLVLLESFLGSQRQLEQKAENYLLVFEQQDTTFVDLFDLSLQLSMPISSTPQLWSREGTLGTHSLLPTLAAICSSILVRMEAVPFFWRVEVTAIWLLRPTPALSVNCFRSLQQVLKLGGMMNQNMFAEPFSHSLVMALSMFFRACLESLKLMGQLISFCCRPRLLQVDTNSVRTWFMSKSVGNITAIFRLTSGLQRALLNSMKLVDRFSSIFSLPPSCSSGNQSCLPVMVVGVFSISMLSFSSMRLGLKASGLREPNCRKTLSMSLSLLEGVTMVLSLISLRLRSSKLSGSPLMSSSSGTRMMSVWFSLLFLESLAALRRGCRLALMLRLQVSEQYSRRLRSRLLSLNLQDSRQTSNSTLSITQYLPFPQLAITVLFSSSSSTSARFSALVRLLFCLQIWLMVSSTDSERTILTAVSILRKSPFSSRTKLLAYPLKRLTRAPQRQCLLWGSKYFLLRPISVYSRRWKKLRTMLFRKECTTADFSFSGEQMSAILTSRTTFRKIWQYVDSNSTRKLISSPRVSSCRFMPKRVLPDMTQAPVRLQMVLRWLISISLSFLMFSRGISGRVRSAQMQT